MMGVKARVFQPMVNLSLEEIVPADHFYRHVERTLDLSFGRPSIDPVVFFKLQLVMFFEDIRSERQLEYFGSDRLSVRWYLGDDLHEPLPDRSSMTRIRDRYGITIFRRFCEAIVERCQDDGLIWAKSCMPMRPWPRRMPTATRRSHVLQLEALKARCHDRKALL